MPTKCVGVLNGSRVFLVTPDEDTKEQAERAIDELGGPDPWNSPAFKSKVRDTFEQTYRQALLAGRSFPDEQCRGYLDAPMDGQML